MRVETFRPQAQTTTDKASERTKEIAGADHNQPQARDVTLDATCTTTSKEVESIQQQIAPVGAGSDVASNARRDLSSSDGSAVQIGARARLATEGLTNVGGSSAGAGAK